MQPVSYKLRLKSVRGISFSGGLPKNLHSKRRKKQLPAAEEQKIPSRDSRPPDKAFFVIEQVSFRGRTDRG